MAAQAGQGGTEALRGGGVGAGDAGDADVVDEAGAALEHGGQAVVVGGGGDEADDVQAVCGGVGQDHRGLLGGEVDDDEAVDAGFRGIGAEALGAVAGDGVEVAHEDDGGVVVGLPKGFDHGEGFAQGCAGLEAAEAGGLDGGAVGHGVGEGHADLDEVGAGGGHAVEDGGAGGEVGVVGLEEGDEGAAVLLFEGGEAGGDAAHSAVPRRCLDAGVLGSCGRGSFTA